mmetsp:Transcript_106551/g.299410  ORF Transcript_106551/g.299410 Transcript_106551/m.299410 type:complete len:626 (+) Transcript_106551:290-2167(+)
MALACASAAAARTAAAAALRQRTPATLRGVATVVEAPLPDKSSCTVLAAATPARTAAAASAAAEERAAMARAAKTRAATAPSSPWARPIAARTGAGLAAEAADAVASALCGKVASAAPAAGVRSVVALEAWGETTSAGGGACNRSCPAVNIKPATAACAPASGASEARDRGSSDRSSMAAPGADPASPTPSASAAPSSALVDQGFEGEIWSAASAPSSLSSGNLGAHLVSKRGSMVCASYHIATVPDARRLALGSALSSARGRSNDDGGSAASHVLPTAGVGSKWGKAQGSGSASRTTGSTRLGPEPSPALAAATASGAETDGVCTAASQVLPAAGVGAETIAASGVASASCTAPSQMLSAPNLFFRSVAESQNAVGTSSQALAAGGVVEEACDPRGAASASWAQPWSPPGKATTSGAEGAKASALQVLPTAGVGAEQGKTRGAASASSTTRLVELGPELPAEPSEATEPDMEHESAAAATSGVPPAAATSEVPPTPASTTAPAGVEAWSAGSVGGAARTTGLTAGAAEREVVSPPGFVRPAPVDLVFEIRRQDKPRHVKNTRSMVAAPWTSAFAEAAPAAPAGPATGKLPPKSAWTPPTCNSVAAAAASGTAPSTMRAAMGVSQ